MYKEIFNLISKATATGIPLDSASGTNMVHPDLAVDNKHSKTGNLYLDASGFVTDTVTGVGFVPVLYYSPEGTNWFIGTSLPTFSTALSSVYPLDNLGRYVRFAYDVNARAGIGSVKVFLELNQKY